MHDDDETPGASDGDEPVGYGKPPRHTRFQKGQSGNPKGRKKADPQSSSRKRKLLEIISEQANELVAVSDDGKQRRMPRIEAFVRRLNQTAATDPRMLKHYVALVTQAEKYVPDKSLVEYDWSRLSSNELLNLHDLLKKAEPKNRDD